VYDIDLLSRRSSIQIRWHSIVLTLCTSVALISFGIYAGGLLLLEKGDLETRAALESETARIASLEEGIERKLQERLGVIQLHADRILWAPMITALAREIPAGDHLREVRYRASDGTVEIRAFGPGKDRFRRGIVDDLTVMRFFPDAGEAIPTERGEYRLVLGRGER